MIATHRAAPIITAPITAPVPASSRISTIVTSASPETGDQSVMPEHCAMMIPANQIHRHPTIAMIAARGYTPSPESSPGFRPSSSSQAPR